MFNFLVIYFSLIMPRYRLTFENSSPKHTQSDKKRCLNTKIRCHPLFSITATLCEKNNNLSQKTQRKIEPQFQGEFHLPTSVSPHSYSQPIKQHYHVQKNSLGRNIFVNDVAVIGSYQEGHPLIWSHGRHSLQHLSRYHVQIGTRTSLGMKDLAMTSFQKRHYLRH